MLKLLWNSIRHTVQCSRWTVWIIQLKWTHLDISTFLNLVVYFNSSNNLSVSSMMPKDIQLMMWFGGLNILANTVSVNCFHDMFFSKCNCTGQHGTEITGLLTPCHGPPLYGLKHKSVNWWQGCLQLLISHPHPPATSAIFPFLLSCQLLALYRRSAVWLLWWLGTCTFRQNRILQYDSICFQYLHPYIPFENSYSSLHSKISNENPMKGRTSLLNKALQF